MSGRRRLRVVVGFVLAVLAPLVAAQAPAPGRVEILETAAWRAGPGDLELPGEVGARFTLAAGEEGLAGPEAADFTRYLTRARPDGPPPAVVLAISGPLAGSRISLVADPVGRVSFADWAALKLDEVRRLLALTLPPGTGIEIVQPPALDAAGARAGYTAFARRDAETLVLVTRFAFGRDGLVEASWIGPPDLLQARPAEIEAALARVTFAPDRGYGADGGRDAPFGIAHLFGAAPPVTQLPPLWLAMAGGLIFVIALRLLTAARPRRQFR